MVKGFSAGPGGVYKDLGDRKSRLICGPLEVVGRTRDQASQNWGYLLRWKDADQIQHEHVLRMEMLTKPHEAVLPLLSGGLAITPGEYCTLLEYIQAASPRTHVRSVNRTGWQDGAFVLPDAVIRPEDAEPVVYQPQALKNNYRVAGTVDEWRNHVGSLCRGNSRLLLAVSCAFAGPVLRLLGEESGGIHFYGPTSSGKSTVAMVAGSVLGGGGRDGFLSSWLATANGLEGSAALHNDTSLILDEVNLVDGRQISAVIYMLANGEGKTRMNCDTLLQQKSTWALTVVSTGELTLQQHAAASGGKLRGGAAVRFPDIVADAGKGMGVFENIHDCDKPAEFSSRLKEASRRHYGAPFREWMVPLVYHPDICSRWLRQRIEAFEKEHRPAGASPEVNRTLHRFAVIAAAGETATELGITGWEEGDASWGCARVLESWITMRGGSGSHDAEEMLRQVRHFLQLHAGSRFLERTTSQGGMSPEAAGPPSPPVRDHAGYRKEDTFWFHSEVFRAEICKGFDCDQVCRVLDERGFLDHAPQRWQKQERVFGMPRWFYVVRKSILEGDVTSNQPALSTVVTPKGLKGKAVTTVTSVTSENHTGAGEGRSAG
jgi:putative DNA primase/helicase